MRLGEDSRTIVQVDVANPLVVRSDVRVPVVVHISNAQPGEPEVGIGPRIIDLGGSISEATIPVVQH